MSKEDLMCMLIILNMNDAHPWIHLKSEILNLEELSMKSMIKCARDFERILITKDGVTRNAEGNCLVMDKPARQDPFRGPCLYTSILVALQAGAIELRGKRETQRWQPHSPDTWRTMTATRRTTRARSTIRTAFLHVLF